MKKTIQLFILLVLASPLLRSQTLEEILNEKLTEEAGPEYVMATFKTGRIINGHNVQNTDKGDLLFVIGHRFGTLNSGFYNFFGLDDATTRLGLDYGVTERINVGLGRSTYQKTFDGFIKMKVLRQETTRGSMPVSLSVLLGTDLITYKDPAAEVEYSFVNRLSYVTQVLVARKFGQRFSLQLSPTFIHKNLVERRIDQNNIFAVGTGGRFKLSNRVSMNAEYFYLLPGQTASDFINSFSLGVDLETGGHVFQLHLTNSRSMIERGFITETTGKWLDGDIHFGFNITRNFGLGRNRYR